MEWKDTYGNFFIRINIFHWVYAVKQDHDFYYWCGNKGKFAEGLDFFQKCSTLFVASVSIRISLAKNVNCNKVMDGNNPKYECWDLSWEWI